MDPTTAALAGVGGVVAVLGLALGLFWSGWQARQPTIDAQDQEVMRLTNALQAARSEAREAQERWKGRRAGAEVDAARAVALGAAGAGAVDDADLFDRVLREADTRPGAPAAADQPGGESDRGPVPGLAGEPRAHGTGSPTA